MKPGTILKKIPRTMKKTLHAPLINRSLLTVLSLIAIVTGAASSALAQSHSTHQPGGEANLKLPDLSQVKFQGIDGHTLLLFGLIICVLGLAFGLAIYTHLRNLPVHAAIREVSELIYETC